MLDTDDPKINVHDVCFQYAFKILNWTKKISINLVQHINICSKEGKYNFYGKIKKLLQEGEIKL